MELKGWRYWSLAVGGALAILLVVADFVLAQTNAAVQARVNQRQQFINQSVELNRVEQTLIRAIAVASERNQDTQLGEVLKEQGIRVSFTPAAPAAAPAPATGAKPPASGHGGKP